MRVTICDESFVICQKKQKTAVGGEQCSHEQAVSGVPLTGRVEEKQLATRRRYYGTP